MYILYLAIEYLFHSEDTPASYDPRTLNFLTKNKFAQQISAPPPNPAAPHPNHMHTSLLGFTLAQIDFHRRRLPHLIPMPSLSSPRSPNPERMPPLLRLTE
jgi:hypothetical protein